MQYDKAEAAKERGICSFDVIATMLRAGALREAELMLKKYLESRGADENTIIAKICLLFESKELYSYLVDGTGDGKNLQVKASKEHARELLSLSDELLSLYDASDAEHRERLAGAVSAFFDALVLCRELDTDGLLTFLSAYREMLSLMPFVGARTGEYDLIQSIYAPKNESFLPTAEMLLSRLYSLDKGAYAAEAFALGCCQLADGYFEEAAESLENALPHHDTPYECAFLLLCCALKVRDAKEFIEADGFSLEHPAYIRLLSTLAGEVEMTQKYTELAQRNLEFHESRARPAKKEPREREEKPKRKMSGRQMFFLSFALVAVLMIACWCLEVFFHGFVFAAVVLTGVTIAFGCITYSVYFDNYEDRSLARMLAITATLTVAGIFWCLYSSPWMLSLAILFSGATVFLIILEFYYDIGGDIHCGFLLSTVASATLAVIFWCWDGLFYLSLLQTAMTAAFFVLIFKDYIEDYVVLPLAVATVCSLVAFVGFGLNIYLLFLTLALGVLAFVKLLWGRVRVVYLIGAVCSLALTVIMAIASSMQENNADMLTVMFAGLTLILLVFTFGRQLRERVRTVLLSVAIALAAIAVWTYFSLGIAATNVAVVPAVMFLCYAFSPKGTSYMFGQDKGLRKFIFFLLCVVAFVFAMNLYLQDGRSYDALLNY